MPWNSSLNARIARNLLRNQIFFLLIPLPGILIISVLHIFTCTSWSVENKKWGSYMQKMPNEISCLDTEGWRWTWLRCVGCWESVLFSRLCFECPQRWRKCENGVWIALAGIMDWIGRLEVANVIIFQMLRSSSRIFDFVPFFCILFRTCLFDCLFWQEEVNMFLVSVWYVYTKSNIEICEIIWFSFDHFFADQFQQIFKLWKRLSSLQEYDIFQKYIIITSMNSMIWNIQLKI